MRREHRFVYLGFCYAPIMKVRFGPAVSSKIADAEELIRDLETVLGFSNEAIELSLTKTSKLVYDTRISELLKKFKYKSVHLPVLKDGDEVIYYPDDSIKTWIKIIDQYIEDICPDTVLVHPDQVRDFKWLTRKYGCALALENLDARKKFGKTIEDMESVFKECPGAKWVFDLNHIYTNDRSMGLATEFFDKFQNRLAHYHISGYGGFHDALCLSREDVIIKGLLSLDYPVIDEGNLLQKGVLEKEFNYITERLQPQKF